MRSQKDKPSSAPAAASEPMNGDEWQDGASRPFWISLKQNPRGPRRVRVTVLAGMVTLDLADPEKNKRRVRLTRSQFESLSHNSDLDIRPAAETEQSPMGKSRVQRQIRPAAKKAAEAPAVEGDDAKPPQVEIDAAVGVPSAPEGDE